ncbi:ROK family protein [Leifsonia kafniensis]|uniref:ROK family protein n=1 Tax=Leifsonia kafniensis TaxID=475957 RepID=A0ABP7KBT1_9MICO
MTSELVLGIDIGGTKIAAGLVNAAGTVIARAEIATPAREGGARILEAAAELGQTLRDGLDPHGFHTVVGVGVGSAGVIDPGTGRVLSATDHLSDWAGTEIGRDLSDAFRLPVFVCNDVHAHAVGEAFVGAGRGHGTVLVAAVGTGIGGAVVIDGQPELGTRGIAGHLGHVPIAEADGVLCPCGKFGHVEAISSGTALHLLYLRNGGDPSVQGTREIVARTDVDPIAHASVVTSARAFGRALGGVINMVDPGVVILAGGMINAGALWWDSMDAGVRENVMPILNDVDIVRAQLGDDAALIGAAHRAFDLQGAHE